MDRDRGGRARLERVEPPDRSAHLRRHDVPGDDADRRGALRRVRDFGERGARSRPLGPHRRLRALRQPPAGAARGHRDGPRGPPDHAGRGAALVAEPERARRRHRGVALLVRRRRLQHHQLVGRSRGRGRPDAVPVGRAGWPAAVRPRHRGADRVRRHAGHREELLGQPSPRRPRPGAPRPQGRRADRDRLDRARGSDHPPVNVYLHTFGCKANQYDTELVRQAFADQGASLVDDPAEADVAVVNSCTVTHEAESKMRRFVRRLARRPRAPGARPLETVVMGCAAALDDGRIARLPAVRAVVPGADPVAVLGAAGYAAPRVDPKLRRFQANARGWLKIQDGCDEHCTFCATTLARGANRSRPIPELVREAQALAQHHAEIVLTGVHIGTYGQDRAADPGAAPRGHPGQDSVRWNPGPSARGQPSLGQLLEALVTAVPEVRFRLSSIEATEVDDRIARLLIEAPKHLAAHLHAPLQSGSNRVLKRMGRHWYTAESYRARIEWLAARLPVFGLGADIIAGFGGEADTDHAATRALVEALPFTYLHVFPFSVRPDAPAARLGGRVAPEVVSARARELRELGDRKALAYREAQRGRRADGVVSGRAAGRLEVVTEDYLSVYLPVDRWDGRPRCEVTVD
ncbi:MAG: hypothetical protein DMD53_06065 [Gemmatimonadetes bacterium]|nr:MAG: hypothetical protein DMD53_06065 [Gemmatimonadota bacterium]